MAFSCPTAGSSIVAPEPLAALDGDIRLSKNYSIDGQYIITHTSEPQDSVRTARYRGYGFDGGKHTIAFDGESYTGTAFIQRFSGKHVTGVLCSTTIK